VPRRALFVFAHQDDEYAAAPWILEELASGAEAACVYLTDGGYRADPVVRDAESVRALRSLGVARDGLAFLGAPDGRIADGALVTRAGEGLATLERWMLATGCEPDCIYAPAYEGGHPDHDAAHVIAAVVAAKRGIADRCWHFAIYNAYRRRAPFFSSLRQLPTDSPSRSAKLSLWTRLQLAVLCRYYGSQLRTWLGLFPGAFVERVVLGRETVVAFDAGRVKRRPHDGELLYERMFGTSYADVERNLRPLIALL
jgi:LmbE family N-acetylglucosaminyl deacetylase